MARRDRAIKVKLLTTVAAAVRVTILSSSGQRLRSEAVAAVAGSTALTLDGGLSEGRRRILARAHTRDGQVATARTTLLVR